MSKLDRLFDVVSAVCPIDGVRDKAPYYDALPAATTQEIANADAAVAAFDWSDAAHAVWEKSRRDTAEPDLKTLRDEATQAIADINTFLAIASPTNAQVLAEVRAIDQRQRAILKALLRLVIRMV